MLYDYGNGWGTGAETIGPYALAGRDRAQARHHRGAREQGAAAGDERAAGGGHGAVHDHALRHHHREREQVAVGLREHRRAERAWPPRRARPRASPAWSSDAADLGDLQEGEILVARITAPSWGPVFGRVGAVVTDIGGMMSHAAIVCREYGLPAVTGTGSATTTDQHGPAHPRRRLRVAWSRCSTEREPLEPRIRHDQRGESVPEATTTPSCSAAGTTRRSSPATWRAPA